MVELASLNSVGTLREKQMFVSGDGLKNCWNHVKSTLLAEQNRGTQ